MDKTIKKTGWRKFRIPLVIGLLLLVNWVASMFHTRIDLTNEKRFTLSQATKNILRKSEGPIEVKVFLKGDFPSGFKKLAKSSKGTLDEFKEIAGSKFTYTFTSPDEVMEGTNTPWADTLASMGLYPINLKSQLKAGEQQQLVYPVALIRNKEKVVPVRLYNGIPNIGRSEINSAEALMEYELSNGIYKLEKREKSMVGYTTGNGEPQDARVYDLVENVLKEEVDLKLVNLNRVPFIDTGFKLLLIVKPAEPFSEIEKLRIDQYVMRGGSVMFFIDKLDAEMDSLQIKNEVIAYDRNLGLDDLLFKYGVRINGGLIMDLQSDRLPFDVNGNGQYEFLSWNYFPVFASRNNHAINKNLAFVTGRFINPIDTVEALGITKTVLLNSSVNARVITAPALISGKENVNAPVDEKFKSANIPAAVLLEGSFNSLYRNRISQSMRDSLVFWGKPFIAQCTKPGKLIVIGDGDIVLNDYTKEGPLPMGMNRFTVGSQYEYQFANRNFLLNSIEYLTDQSGLIEAKSKDYRLRLIDTKKASSEIGFWQLINIALPVLLVVLFGISFNWYRKKQYVKHTGINRKT